MLSIAHYVSAVLFLIGLLGIFVNIFLADWEYLKFSLFIFFPSLIVYISTFYISGELKFRVMATFAAWTFDYAVKICAIASFVTGIYYFYVGNRVEFSYKLLLFLVSMIFYLLGQYLVKKYPTTSDIPSE